MSEQGSIDEGHDVAGSNGAQQGQGDQASSEAIEAAKLYLGRGWAVIPIPLGSKQPAVRGWQNLRLREEDLLATFDGPGNVGVLLGEPSGGLADVDLDDPLAVRAAGLMLEPSGAVFGRAGKPRSHWLYLADPIPSTERFKDTDGSVLVELRATGAQTVFPPSVHPTGESVSWCSLGEPERVDGAALRGQVARLAAAAALARHWPAVGSRQDAALALAGALLRARWDRPTVESFLGAVVELAGDDDSPGQNGSAREQGLEKRLAAVRYTEQRLASGGDATGWPTLASLVGERVVASVQRWLGLAEPHETSPVRLNPRPDSVACGTFEDIGRLIGPVKWAWPGWLPIGLLTIIAGEPGSGKSALALRIGACFLRGDPWPDGLEFADERGKVLWCEAESAQAVNLERARAWGLALGQLVVLAPGSDVLMDLRLDNDEHMDMLKAAANRGDVRLVVVDSLRGANRKDENSSETIALVLALAGIARDANKPVLLTHHLRKRGLLDRGDGVGLDRLRGSTAIVQAARVVWALDTPDPGRPQVRRLSVIKNNLARFPKPLGVIVHEMGVSFPEPPEPQKKETQVSKAADMLRAFLAAGPVAEQELELRSRDAGISKASLDRAKDQLDVVSFRQRDCWYWALPPLRPPSSGA